MQRQSGAEKSVLPQAESENIHLSWRLVKHKVCRDQIDDAGYHFELWPLKKYLEF